MSMARLGPQNIFYDKLWGKGISPIYYIVYIDLVSVKIGGSWLKSGESTCYVIFANTYHGIIYLGVVAQLILFL